MAEIVVGLSGNDELRVDGDYLVSETALRRRLTSAGLTTSDGICSGTASLTIEVLGPASEDTALGQAQDTAFDKTFYDGQGFFIAHLIYSHAEYRKRSVLVVYRFRP